MNRRKLLVTGIVAVTLTILGMVVASPFGEARVDRNTRLKLSLKKPDITDIQFIGVNNWSYVMRNNGSYFYDSPDADGNGNNAGGEFPRGSGTTIVFAGGLYIASLKNGIKVVSETEFVSEFQPGRIINEAVPFSELTADDPALPDNRVYVIGRKITDGDDDVWPAEGIRNSEGDAAVIADGQTWAVFNDLDTQFSQEGASVSPDPGLGMQIILESYAISAGPLQDVVFMRFIIENKTDVNYTNSYLGLWMDPDVDNASNDIVGVDTARGLGFCYNADNSDQAFCTGFDFFQGPIVNTADVSATLAAKFAANTTVLVWDEVVARYVPTTLPPGQIWLGATSFNTYANGTDPEDNIERYNLLAGLFANGNAKFGQGISDYYAFRGNPVTTTGPDVATTADQADQRMLHGVGPFTIGAGDAQTIWAGVVGAGGSDRINAVANMFATDDVAQITFNAGLIAPVPPDVPEISVSALNGQVVVTWKNNAEFSEDIVGEIQNISTSGNFTEDYLKYDFQGYRVWKSRTGLSGSYTMLAEYDKIDNFTVIENLSVNSRGNLEKADVVVGTNSGLRYSYVDDDVVNGQTYYYGVTAYDAQPYIARTDISFDDPIVGTIDAPSALPISLETSPTDNVVSVVPMAPLVGQDYSASVSTVTHSAGISDGSVVLEVVDPTLVKSQNYTLEFFSIPVDCVGAPLVGSAGGIAYRIVSGTSILTLDNRADDPRTFYDVNGNDTFNVGIDIRLDDSKFGVTQASSADEATEEPVIVDGIKITVFGPALDAKFFQVISTGGGALSAPDMGAFAFNAWGFPTIDGQPAGGDYAALGAGALNDRPNVPNLLTTVGDASAANGGKWGIHVGGGTGPYNDGSTTSFVARVFRGSNFTRFIPYDWEIRFTAAGGFGAMAFSTGTFAPVPFELWRIGIGTPNDPSDDYRCIPWIFDEDGDDAYGLMQIDHPLSGGDNDPYTDWVYFRQPRDFSTATAGYDDFIADGELNYDYGDPEVMARTVLCNFNGGSVSDGAWPANVNQLLPATGTVFRIISTKPNATDDQFTFSGTARNAAPTKAEMKSGLKNAKVVPNPYYGRSEYQESLFDKRIKFINLPGTCTIRVFTVSGDLVATIAHNATSNNDRTNSNPLSATATGTPAETSVETWDLRNPGGKFVASGMYVAVIDAPGIGKKTLKFAVIQEEIKINGPDVR